MGNKIKGEFYTKKVGNSVYLHLHKTANLVQVSDGFERVTLTYRELDEVMEEARKFARERNKDEKYSG